MTTVSLPRQRFEEKIKRISLVSSLLTDIFANPVDKLFKLLPKIIDKELIQTLDDFKSEFQSFEELVEYSHINSLINLVCAFEFYLKEFYTERLGDSENNLQGIVKIDIRDITEARDKESILKLCFVNHIESIFHQNISDFFDLAKKTLNNSTYKVDYGMIKKCIRIRNLFIHQDGIMTSRFIKECGLPDKTTPGERYKLDMEEYFNFKSEVSMFVHALDAEDPTVKKRLRMNLFSKLQVPDKPPD